MTYAEQIDKAIDVCFEAHAGQVDKGGTPYAWHPIHVACQMRTEPETIAALLHDIVEDTRYTLQDLREMGFDKAVLDAVEVLTRSKRTQYMEYIEAVSRNPIARAVKKADLLHNMDLTRLKRVEGKDINRWHKYKKAFKRLEEADNAQEG